MRFLAFSLLACAALPLALSTAQSPQSDDAYYLDEDTGITLLKGFDADLVYDVPEREGSWVAMAFDPKGRLIVSDQDHKGVYRVTLPEQDGGRVRVENLRGFPYDPIPWGKRTVGGALGFLYAFDSLYMSTMKGFYRCRDTDGDDQYDEFTLLKKLYVGYEHSAHSIVLSEDGEALYLVSGNHSRVPDGVDPLLPPVWQEDMLLPTMNDPSGHAVGIGPPAGWIARISPDGSEWTLVASGLRNSVDLAINPEGELFTYDSDLEFDIGSPWYRPTRLNHVISGAEFGWRAGSAKWPDYYEDSVGSVLDIGPGSPTGMSFGHHSSFPAEFQDDLFLCDWTFGTIYQVELEEDGSSYTGSKREFLKGQPLNIAAMRFGPDGHMYFVVGGRNTDSKLYRVRYVGGEAGGEVRKLSKNQRQRDLRRAFETHHGSQKGGAKAVAYAWPYLMSSDRATRYAARLAIENQDLEIWREMVLEAEPPRLLIQGAIALARHGKNADAAPLLARLQALDFGALDRVDQLALLRAYALCFLRLAPPTPSETEAIIDQLDPAYPAGDKALNTELCRVLCYLEAPTVVDTTLALMRSTQTEALAYDEEMLGRHEYGKVILETLANTPNIQNIHYAFCLRGVQTGWTLDARKEYFGWLNETLQKSGGQSFAGYIRGIREQAIAALPEEDAAAVAWLLGDIDTVDLTALPQPQGPARAWTLAEARALFQGELRGRDFENGKRMFDAGRCVACHRFAGSGGRSGPDLGSVGQRYSVEDILTAIIDPSDSISEQYQASILRMQDGSQLIGRVIYHNTDEIAVASNPYDFAQLSKHPAAQVESIEPSPTSLMPPGTINLMNEEELKDLMAYLLSGGNSRHAVFQAR
ncbi:MAG: heme-binding protein [Planctomycetes bacterium]|nr:heme-binding protein [Planctomycetota bacterium]